MAYACPSTIRTVPGRREFFSYHDLLVRDATNGAMSAQVMKATRGLSKPTGWHYHDWTADPYAHGAYSYVPAGALDAQSELGRSIEDTLFFAGEATAPGGWNGTVDGAIESGYRAAREILAL